MRLLSKQLLIAGMLALLPALSIHAQDDCANAQAITVGSSCITQSFTSIGATDEPTTVAPNPTCGLFQGSDVWFTFVVPASGDFRVEMTSAGNNSVWELYSGTCGSFTSIVCASATADQLMNFSDPSLAGQTLYLRTWRFNNAAGIDFDLCIWEPPVPTNNNCASATSVTVGTSCTPTSHSHSSLFSTTEDVSVGPNPTCGGYQGGDVWFDFVVPASGNFRIEMTSAGNNSLWALYTGTCGNFTQITCAGSGNTLSSNFSDPTLAGQTLYLRAFRFVSPQGIDFDCAFMRSHPPLTTTVLMRFHSF